MLPRLDRRFWSFFFFFLTEGKTGPAGNHNSRPSSPKASAITPTGRYSPSAWISRHGLGPPPRQPGRYPPAMHEVAHLGLAGRGIRFGTTIAGLLGQFRVSAIFRDARRRCLCCHKGAGRPTSGITTASATKRATLKGRPPSQDRSAITRICTPRPDPQDHCILRNCPSADPSCHHTIMPPEVVPTDDFSDGRGSGGGWLRGCRSRERHRVRSPRARCRTGDGPCPGERGSGGSATRPGPLHANILER